MIFLKNFKEMLHCTNTLSIIVMTVSHMSSKISTDQKLESMTGKSMKSTNTTHKVLHNSLEGILK